ncbi:MAG: hypothetical protein M5T52_16560 [Ignavibacteriaceae bacterium]|nr:hypothetical protein [Ignavibacteriaceae bacterium]
MKKFLIVDGKEINNYDNLDSWNHFSPDGSRLAFVVLQDSSAFVVVDDKEQKNITA